MRGEERNTNFMNLVVVLASASKTPAARDGAGGAHHRLAFARFFFLAYGARWAAKRDALSTRVPWRGHLRRQRRVGVGVGVGVGVRRQRPTHAWPLLGEHVCAVAVGDSRPVPKCGCLGRPTMTMQRNAAERPTPRSPPTTQGECLRIRCSVPPPLPRVVAQPTGVTEARRRRGFMETRPCRWPKT